MLIGISSKDGRMAEQAAEVLDTGNQEEPSMEEILASIRKIITEEEEDPAAATAEGATTLAEEDVIDLTEGELISPAEEQTIAAVTETAIKAPEIPNEPIAAGAPTPEPVATAPIAPEPTPAPTPEPVATEVASEPIVVPEIVAKPETNSTTPEVQTDTAPIVAQKNDSVDTDIDLIEEPPLLSEQSAEVAGKAFHDLALKINLLGNKENTLEGVVKELLRPMLKEWLDENLPRMVLKMVRKEIEKITQ